MTYCLAMQLDSGLVFCADSRTNAGADQVNTYSKMHRFTQIADRTLIILSAGNLATSQAVLEQVRRDLEQGELRTLSTCNYMSEIADYIGELSIETQGKYAPAGPEASFNAGASFIIGGQIEHQEPALYMVYPEGNHITVSKHHPYLQIGEVKYGKPILERIVRNDTDYQTAMRCALVSMDSTMRSNATVGPPVELAYYAKNEVGSIREDMFFDDNDPYLRELGDAWDKSIVDAFNNLPPINSPLNANKLK